MAYLSPRFKNDIFLSYARVNNQLRPGMTEGWVDKFRKYLEIELSNRTGRVGEVTIWMDEHQLDGGQYIDDEIKDQIEQSGIFLALTSAGYLHPDSYCQKELKCFYEKAQRPPETLRVGNRSRIFNALLNNIPLEQWPRAFEDRLGLPLYDNARTNFGDPSRIGGELFETQILKLADAIFALLSKYKSSLLPPTPPPPPEDALKVFLADTPESLSELRDSVLLKFKKEGIQVVKRMPPPWVSKEHDSDAQTKIAEVDLSIHLLDATPGEKFINGDSGETFLQRQAKLGREHAKSQFVWVPPPALLDIQAVKDPGYRDLLQEFDKDDRDESRYSFVRAPERDVPQEIINYLRRPKPEPQKPETHTMEALLETHRKDQLRALDLYQLLVEKNIQPRINPGEDDPQKNFEQFQALIQTISVLIIIYGSVASEWVRERLNSSLQLAGTVEPPRLKLCGIYAPADGVARQVSLGVFPGLIPIYSFDKPEQLATLLDRHMGGN
jgi:hypothetical protein